MTVPNSIDVRFIDPDADGPLPSRPDLASRIVGIKLRVRDEDVLQSTKALAAALPRLDDPFDFLASGFADLFHLIGDDGDEMCLRSSDVVFAPGCNITTDGAGETTLFLHPSQRYVELVAAVAAHLKLDVIQIHDWPVLSVDVSTTTVSEAAGVSIPAAELPTDPTPAERPTPEPLS